MICNDRSLTKGLKTVNFHVSFCIDQPEETDLQWFAAVGRFAFSSILVRESTSREEFLPPCQKTVGQYCWREFLERWLHGGSERIENDRRGPALGYREGLVESLCVMDRSPTY